MHPGVIVMLLKVLRNRTSRAAYTCLVALATLAVETAHAQLFLPENVYEGNVLPEQQHWQLQPPGPAEGELRVEDGWFIQTVRDDGQGTSGEYNFHRKELDEFVGTGSFFVEWRAITDNPAWLIDARQAPAGLSLAGQAGVLYRTVLTESASELLRDVLLPRVVVPVTVNEPHIYRVELYPDEYIWYVDGIVADSGTPEGPYPDQNGFLVWGAGREHVDATTAWDYVRYGEIPPDGSGDWDNNGYSDSVDGYFVRDCLDKDGPGIFGGPDQNAGPGCSFADFDGDADVDLFDLAEFQNIFTEVPCEPLCRQP